MDAGDDDFIKPFWKSLNAIMFADTTIQNMSDLPSPWALEIGEERRKAKRRAERARSRDSDVRCRCLRT